MTANFFIKYGLRLLFSVSCLTLISGCGATHTALNKRHLDVQTQMSSTVFLDPITAENKRTVFLQIRNTSDKPGLDLNESIALCLEEKGYQLTHRPEEAHYVLQANVLQVGRCDLRAAQHALSQGFGATLSGAAVGAGVGSLVKHKNNKDVAVVGGLVGAAVSTVTDAMVQDVVYTAVVDVQISERVGNSVIVKEKTKSKLKQGNYGAKEITSTETVAWKRYQTRVVSTANQVNLKFEKAAPLLIKGLTQSISGIF